MYRSSVTQSDRSMPVDGISYVHVPCSRRKGYQRLALVGGRVQRGHTIQCIVGHVVVLWASEWHTAALLLHGQNVFMHIHYIPTDLSIGWTIPFVCIEIAASLRNVTTHYTG